jgi:ribosomal protein S18 acetylase RimI-like enzyme
MARPTGRGDGSRFLQSILQICFNELAAHRVDLLVHMENERARRVYTRTSFVEEGILRDYHRAADGSCSDPTGWRASRPRGVSLRIFTRRILEICGFLRAAISGVCGICPAPSRIGAQP